MDQIDHQRLGALAKLALVLTLAAFIAAACV